LWQYYGQYISAFCEVQGLLYWRLICGRITANEDVEIVTQFRNVGGAEIFAFQTHI
jgi:hypothetical protein